MKYWGKWQRRKKLRRELTTNDNKCKICGLRAEVLENDEKFVLCHKLFEAGIVKQRFPRNIFLRTKDSKGNSQRDEYCVIGSNKWNKIHESCTWWQFKNEELGLDGHVSIYHAKRNAKSARFLAIVAIGISTLILSVFIFNSFFK